MSGKWRALLVLLPLVAYSPAARCGFVWDDHRVLEHARLLGSLANVPRLFLHDTMFNSDGGAFAAAAHVDTYRPLTMTSFAVERAVFGLRPWAYHLDSVAIHAACVVLAFAVGRVLGLSEAAALVGALIFGVHPALGEAVYWVNGRSDPLCVLFFLLALWAWLTGRSAWSVAAATLAATLCKETAFVLLAPLIVLAGGRGGLRALAPFAVGAALGLAARLGALGHPAVSAGSQHFAYAAARLVPLWLDGLRALALPVGQAPPSLFERYRHLGAGELALAGGVMLLLTVAALAVWRRGDARWAWALGSFAAALAPVALLTYREGWYGWGRYLYPATPALALMAGALVVDVALPRLRPKLRQIAAGALALAVALLAASTFAAGRDWRDDRAFARAIVNDHPESSIGYSELAAVELNDGHADEALRLAERALALEPANHKHWSRAATALMQLGRRPEAYRAAARALELDESDANGDYITAIRLLGERNESQAAVRLLFAISEEPDEPGPWATLRQALTHLGPESVFAQTVRSLIANDRRFAFIAPRL